MNQYFSTLLSLFLFFELFEAKLQNLSKSAKKGQKSVVSKPFEAVLGPRASCKLDYLSNHAQETSGASQPQVGGGWMSHLLGNPHRTDYDAMQGKVKVDSFLVSFLSSDGVLVFKVK